MDLFGIPRVSSNKQTKGDSVDAQILRFNQYCQSGEHKLLGVWKEDVGKSASISDKNHLFKFENNIFWVGFDVSSREALQRFLRDIDKKYFDGILIYKWDRIFRDPSFADLITLYAKLHNKAIIPTDDPEDPLSSGIIQQVSKYEITKMKARVRNTRLKRFEEGMMVARPPLGYKLNKVKKTIEIDTPKAKVIQKVFQMASEGDDYKTICAICDLAPQQVYNIIRNKTYMGIITFEGVEKIGTHEPLVTKEIWDKANHV